MLWWKKGDLNKHKLIQGFVPNCYMFSIWHLSKLLYMWGTFIVRDCLCVWAIIFNVCHSQRDGTVLHMLCNQAHSWGWIVKIHGLSLALISRCLGNSMERSRWKGQMSWQFESSLRKTWPLTSRQSLTEVMNYPSGRVCQLQTRSSYLLTTNSSVTPVIPCHMFRFLYCFMY